MGAVKAWGEQKGMKLWTARSGIQKYPSECSAEIEIAFHVSGRVREIIQKNVGKADNVVGVVPGTIGEQMLYPSVKFSQSFNIKNVAVQPLYSTSIENVIHIIKKQGHEASYFFKPPNSIRHAFQKNLSIH